MAIALSQLKTALIPIKNDSHSLFQAFQNHLENVQKKMQQEVEKLGLALHSGGGQDEYERRVMDIEQKSIKNPYIEWDIKYAELTVRRIA